MFGLKNGTNSLSANGLAPNNLFEDISTRSLTSVFVGNAAGKLSRGDGNAFIGYECGKQNLNGSFGVFVGFQAGALNQNGNYNTFVGTYAGRANSLGDNNTFVGFRCGELNANGSECVAIGMNAMRENATGNQNVAVGVYAGERILDGDQNVLIGSEAGQNMRSGNLNTITGHRAGRDAFRGNENTYFGAYSGYSNSYGDGNCFIGHRSGYSLRSGDLNVGVGANVLANASMASSNVALGAFAGSHITGSGNVLLGTGAGMSNLAGDNSTIVGTDAAYNANGDENVFVGKDAAYNLEGSRNVVIGVNAFSKANHRSTGSVVIGYNVANNNFSEGSNNIFIGSGADATIENTSHAIAIGSCNTNAGEHSIAIGEYIENAGMNAVSLGYNVYSDSDQCVSIGHEMIINNVIVFNDSLNWRFPVSANQQYDIFNLKEYYTDMLYLYDESNNIAVATVYGQNEYDSGTNVLNGTTRTGEIDLLGSFDYNVLYSPQTIEQTETSALTTTVSDLLNQSNLFKLINRKGAELTNVLPLPLTTLAINNIDLSSNERSYSIDLTTLYTQNAPNSIALSSNLIPSIGGSNIDYTILIGKRVTIDTIDVEPMYTTFEHVDRKFLYINQRWPIDLFDNRAVIRPPLLPNEISKLSLSMVYNNKYYVKDKPRYGQINAHIFDNIVAYQTMDYTPYPEALYVNHDTFSRVLVNQMTNIQTGHANGVYIEETGVQTQKITFDNREQIYTNSTIYLHPNTTTLFDRSYFNVIPPDGDSVVGDIHLSNLDPNLRIVSGGQPPTMHTFTIAYATFIVQPLTIEIIDIRSPITTPMTLTFKNRLYTYNFVYTREIQYQIDPYAIDVVIDTFNLTEVTMPDVGEASLSIVNNPRFGKVRFDGHAIKYRPHTYNFGTDTFKIATGEATDGYTKIQKHITFNLKTSNAFNSLLLNKMQEAVADDPSTEETVIREISRLVPTVLYVFNSNATSVTLDGQPWTDPVGHTTTVSIQRLEYTENYRQNSNIFGSMQMHFYGYPFRSNVFRRYDYTSLSLSNFMNEVASNDIGIEKIDEPTTATGGRDYIVYKPVPNIRNPEVKTNRYNVDYNTGQRIDRLFYQEYQDTNLKYYATSNLRSSNRYFDLVEKTTTEYVYRFACNLEIYTSNLVLQYDIYNDRYSNYIYTATTQISDTARSTLSNFTYLADMDSPVRFLQSDYEVDSSRYQTHYISTIQLQDTNVFEYDGRYTLSNTTSNDGFVIFHKGVGAVSSFHQSNITQKEIHIVNTLPVIDVPTIRSLYFDDHKHIDIRYFKAASGMEGGAPSPTLPPVFTFVNGVDDTAFKFEQTFQKIAIQHTSNIAFVDVNTKYPMLSYMDGDAPVHAIATKEFEESVYIDYINYDDNGGAHSPIRVLIPAVNYINTGIELNIGVDEEMTYITSNELRYIRSGNPVVYYKILDIPARLKIYRDGLALMACERFSQTDIDRGRISLVGDDISVPVESIKLLIETVDGNGLQNIDVVVSKYIHNKFLPLGVGVSNVILQLKDTYEHQLFGNIWDRMRAAYDVNKRVADVRMHITKNPTKGFLYSSNLSNVLMVNSLSYNDMLTHKIHYIPYDPMVLSNDSIEVFFGASNIGSPIYTVPLKNYWSRWGQLVVPINNKVLSDYAIDLPISAGMVADGLKWTIPPLTNPTRVSLNYQNIVFDLPVYAEPIAQRPYFLTLESVLAVNISNYTYLDRLLTTIDNPTNVVTFFIIDPPERGVILKQYASDVFNAVASFTMEDIRDKLVFYQHYGDTIYSTDVFKVKVGANNYDLSTGVHVVTMNILPSPQLLANNYDYIYYKSIHEGSNAYNIIDTSRLNFSTGSIYIYEKTNIDVFRRGADGTTYEPTVLLTNDDINQKNIYYRPSADLFRYGSNQNENMSFKFIVNTNKEIIEPNKLAVFDIYKDIFKHEWFSKYNTFDSYNTIVGYIDSNQTITYTKDPDPTQNLPFEEKKCRFQFDYRPFQLPLLNEKNPASVLFGNEYLAFLKTYLYTFELIDRSGHVFFKIIFRHDRIEACSYLPDTKTTNLCVTRQNEKRNPNNNSLFDFDTVNEWNKFYMINFDDTNNRNLSIYFNDMNYTEYNNEGDVHFESIDLRDLGQIRINVPFENILNFSGDTFQTTLIDERSRHYIYYNLTNFYTQVYFRNFNILLEAFDTDEFTYNVVLGNQLKINGFNNICVGKNFITSGSGSIIIGNDIGSKPNSTTLQAGFFNEIYSSIIISSTSFINTKVRDMIAIGNNILNGAGTGKDIDAFLSKKPVIIGNDISAEMIDYHINFQNTFLKTTIGNPQIYCGYSAEPVCIGYSNNQKFNDEYKLYVNGGIQVNGSLVHSDGAHTQAKRQLFGNLCFTNGNTHACAIRVNWSNMLTTHYHTFSINIKFRFIRNTTSYAYYNFETWIIPVIVDAIILTESFGVTTTKTADISNLTHTLARESATSVVCTIGWNTLSTLTTLNYILGTLEIESVYPIALGTLSYGTTLISTTTFA